MYCAVNHLSKQTVWLIDNSSCTTLLLSPGVPVDFICSIDKDVFRKPCTGMYTQTVEHPSSLSALMLHSGMWDFLVQARLGGVDLSRCLYVGRCDASSIPATSRLTASSSVHWSHCNVGDAAGRAKDGTRKKDFSDTDYKLALNVGIEVRIYLSCCL